MIFPVLTFQNRGTGALPIPPQATSFYVSELGTGTGEGTEEDPFTGTQFLNLVDTGLPGIPTGAVVYFNRGEVFPYQYNVDNGGINFAAYGTGDDPVISGSDAEAGSWTLDSDDVYWVSMASEPKWVFGSDGVELKMSETAWIAITGRPVQTQVSANQTTLQTLDGVEELEGSYILCKEWPFRPCLRRTVTAYNGTTTLTLDAAPNTDALGAATGMPFKLLNKRSYITDVGEWSYDATADRLYVKTAGGAPTGIRISTRDYGIKIASGLSNVSCTGIKFTHQFLEGFYSEANHNVSVTYCKFEDLRTNGASFTGDGTDITFSNNTLTRISNNGVHIGAIDGGIINSNTFSEMGTQDGVSIPYYSYFKSVGCGIHTRWDSTGTIWVPQNLQMNYNTFENMGYIPLVFTGINCTAQFNFIDTYCLRWTDGGGIYVTNVYGVIYGNGSDTTNGLVSNNVVLNGVGGPLSLDGITGGTNTIVGIYLDNNCSSINVDNNYIENCSFAGVFSNVSNQDHSVTNNYIVGCLDGIQFRKYEDANPNIGLYPLSNGHICTGNVVIGNKNDQICMHILSQDNDSYNPFASGGQCDNNTYINPYRNVFVKTDFSGAAVERTLASWQAIFTLDTNSTSNTQGLVYVDATKAALDVVTFVNYTNAEDSFSLPGASTYQDYAQNVITEIVSPAYSGRAAFRVPTVFFDDTYTGSAGDLTGHTPDVGTAWSQELGTFALNGSGYVTASVAGFLFKTVATDSVQLETIGRVSATGALNLIFRKGESANSDRVLVRINISTTGADTVDVIVDSTTIQSYDPGTLAINTDYTLRAQIEGGSVTVWFNGTVVIQLINNATIAAKNPTSKKHGLFIGTTASHNRTTMYEI